MTIPLDKTTILKTFNTHFFDFLDDIITILPENNEVKVARESFDTIKRTNPTAIAKVWYSNVYKPYEEKFDSGNISFFLDKDYSEDLQNLSNSSRIIGIIDQIRIPIKNMSPDNLNHSTKYIQNLCKLSVMYNNATMK